MMRSQHHLAIEAYIYIYIYIYGTLWAKIVITWRWPLLAETCSYFLLLNTIINPYYHSCVFMTDIYLTIRRFQILEFSLWNLSQPLTVSKPPQRYSMLFVPFTDSHNPDRECEGRNMQRTWQKRDIHSESCHKILSKDTIKETSA